MASKAAHPSDDPRVRGWPCGGQHQPGATRNNQYATWMCCAVCGLRLQYHCKGRAQGHTRTAGPSPEIVQEALDELMATTNADDMTEMVVKGKILEISGRMMQNGIRPAMNTVMEERATKGKGKGKTKGRGKMEPEPTCENRRAAAKSQAAPSAAKSQAAPKRSAVPPIEYTEPEEDFIPLPNLETALNRVAVLEERLKAAGLDAEITDWDDIFPDEPDEQMSTSRGSQRASER